MTKATVFGRLWIYDTGDPSYIELWEHELEPMDYPLRSGAEWARNHLSECYGDDELRDLFELPATGNFQVLFKGTISGWKSCSMDGDDYEEEFDVEEKKSVSIPDVFMIDKRHEKLG